MRLISEQLTAADPLRELSPIIEPDLRLARVAAIANEPVPAAGRGGSPRAQQHRVLRVATCGVLAAGALSAAGLALRAEDRPAALPGAVQALADQLQRRDGILHVVTGPARISIGTPDEERAAGREEFWLALDRTGWRASARGADACHDLAMDAEGVQRRRSCRSGRLKTFQPDHRFTDDEWLGLVPGGSFIAATLLDGAKLRPEGEAIIDGHPAYKASDPNIGRNRTIYYFAKDDGRLLRATYAAVNPYHPNDPPVRGQRDFTTFEILPDTSANRALTRLPPRK